MANKISLAGLGLAAMLAAAPGVRAAEDEAAAPCRPSDIGGEWLMMTNNDYAPSICTLKINNKGVVKEGLCTTGRDEAILTGQIVVAKNCAVAGRYKLKTPGGVFTREVSLGIMATDHSFFTMVAFERGGKELNTSFVQRIPQ